MLPFSDCQRTGTSPILAGREHKSKVSYALLSEKGHPTSIRNFNKLGLVRNSFLWNLESRILSTYSLIIAWYFWPPRRCGVKPVPRIDRLRSSSPQKCQVWDRRELLHLQPFVVVVTISHIAFIHIHLSLIHCYGSINPSPPFQE